MYMYCVGLAEKYFDLLHAFFFLFIILQIFVVAVVILNLKVPSKILSRQHSKIFIFIFFLVGLTFYMNINLKVSSASVEIGSLRIRRNCLNWLCCTNIVFLL